MSEQSLAYRALDAQVLAGHADDVALTDADSAVTFAQLLHESASIAGALKHFAIDVGTRVRIDEPHTRQQAVALLALIRLGAVPSDDSELALVGDVPELLQPGEEPVAWWILEQGGRTDPAAARESDDPGYVEDQLARFGAVLNPLLEGRPAELG